MASVVWSFAAGPVFHAFSRVGGLSIEFSDEELAATFVTSLRLAMGRDEV